ncbi:MAG: site-specific integrase [Candidatus Bathyarchaeota archaeon]|nr:site-specific integrase [Candidatus Bathyarchaeota archaeon]
MDAVNRIITLNNPEKNSNPRIFKVSSKLIDMLNALPKTSKRVFGDRSMLGRKATLYRSRKLIAKKLQNPRILRIHFHTLRHWKATILYHQTKDVIYVKNFLGHKRIENTLLYIQLAETIFKDVSDQFISRVAKTVKGARSLIEAGFEYVTDMNGLKIFRKRK